MRRDQRTNHVVAWGRTLTLAVVLVLAQVTIVDQAGFGGYFRLDLPLLLVIAVASVARSDHAAVVGFATGLAVDLFQIGPFGRHSLIFCLVAFTLSSLLGGRGLGRRVLGPGSVSVLLHDAGARALVAGTATVFASCGLIIVAAVVEPSVPTLSAMVSGVPLGALTGAIVGIQLLSWLVRRADLVAGHRSRLLGSWAKPSAGAADTWQNPLSPIRRL